MWDCRLFRGLGSEHISGGVGCLVDEEVPIETGREHVAIIVAECYR